MERPFFVEKFNAYPQLSFELPKDVANYKRSAKGSNKNQLRNIKIVISTMLKYLIFLNFLMVQKLYYIFFQTKSNISFFCRSWFLHPTVVIQSY